MTFHLTDAQTLLDSKAENVELPGVFVRGCSLRFPGFLCQNICDICGVIFCFRCFLPFWVKLYLLT